MKASIKISSSLIILFLMTVSVSGQTCTTTTLDRNIELDGTSKSEEIKVSVSEDIKCLFIGLNSTIDEGSLTLEIFDPNGDRQGNFSVESNSGNSAKSKEMVCGQMHKEIKNPITGDWTVKLKPKKAKGKIGIHTMQMQQKK